MLNSCLRCDSAFSPTSNYRSFYKKLLLRAKSCSVLLVIFHNFRCEFLCVSGRLPTRGSCPCVEAQATRFTSFTSFIFLDSRCRWMWFTTCSGIAFNPCWYRTSARNCNIHNDLLSAYWAVGPHFQMLCSQIWNQISVSRDNEVNWLMQGCCWVPQRIHWCSFVHERRIQYLGFKIIWKDTLAALCLLLHFRCCFIFHHCLWWWAVVKGVCGQP